MQNSFLSRKDRYVEKRLLRADGGVGAKLRVSGLGANRNLTLVSVRTAYIILVRLPAVCHESHIIAPLGTNST